jgi:hypothetical protein
MGRIAFILIIALYSVAEARFEICRSKVVFSMEIQKIIRSHNLSEKSVKSLAEPGNAMLGSGFVPGETMDAASIKESLPLFNAINKSMKIDYIGIYENSLPLYCVGFRGIEYPPYSEYAFCTGKPKKNCYWLEGIYAISEIKKFKP